MRFGETVRCQTTYEPGLAGGPYLMAYLIGLVDQCAKKEIDVRLSAPASVNMSLRRLPDPGSALTIEFELVSRERPVLEVRCMDAGGAIGEGTVELSTEMASPQE